MQKLQDFRLVAGENGFVEVESEENGTVWFRNSTPDAVSAVHKRLCLDTLTNSATVFWETAPVQLNSLTFRTATALQNWLVLNTGKPRK